MPTTRIFPLQEFSNVTTALPQIVRFLINDHASITGPGWTIVEAYDGTTREVPSDVTDMDTFSVGFGWRTSSLAAGDWIVLESANANNANHFQLYIELDSTTNINFMLIPFEDFPTSDSLVSPPLFTTSSFGSSSGSFVAMSTFAASAQYTIAADEGMMALLADQTGSNAPRFIYIGEIDSLQTTGSLDDRSYVIRSAPSNVGHTDSATARWQKLSPLDNKTVLSGYPNMWYSWGSNNRTHDTATDRGNLLGLDTILPVSLWFTSPGHTAGYLRNIFSGHENLPETSGTLSGSNYLHRRNETEPNIVMSFDGSTAFGRDSSGSLLVPPNHYDFLASGSYIASIDFDNTRIWGVTGSITNLEPASTGTVQIINTISGSFITGTFDKNRLRITYPSRRKRPRPADVIEQTVIVS